MSADSTPFHRHCRHRSTSGSHRSHRTARGSLSAPLRCRDRRTLANDRFDRELVHQSTHARESQSQSARRGVSVLHRLFNVRDPWSSIRCDDGDPAPVSAVQRLEPYLAASGIGQRIPRQLGNRGGNSYDIGGGEAELNRQGPALLPCNDDVAVGINRHPDLTRGGNRLHRADPQQEPRQISTPPVQPVEVRETSSRSSAVATPSGCRPNCTMGERDLRLHADQNGPGAVSSCTQSAAASASRRNRVRPSP